MRILAYVLGAILNFMLYAGAREVGDLEFWQAFALLAVLNFVAILLHELGHTWAFRHVGGSVQKIAVMFLTFDVRKRRLTYSNRMIGSDIGGYVAGRYANDRPTVRAVIIVAAAGPVANAVSGVVALAMAALVGRPRLEPPMVSAASTPTSSGNLPSDAAIASTLAQWYAAVQSHFWLTFGYTALLLFGALSLGLALLNLLPYGGSDGQSIGRAVKQWRMMGGGR
jgi:pimeloyl-ACP methyl ester carboxylesterase